MRLRRPYLPISLVVLGVSGCELQEITLVDLVDVLVAEVYVTLAEDSEDNLVRAFLHGTPAGAESGSQTFDDARVTVTREDGLTLTLVVSRNEECLRSYPKDATGTCFLAEAALASSLQTGDTLELEIVLSDGRTLFGTTSIPGSFQIDSLDPSGLDPSCRMEPDELMTVRWSRSAGAWAYVNETSIIGLADALAPDGIDVKDPLYLLGLSISANDTTIVFPSEFGIFDRFELDQDLTVRLQQGLPAFTNANISITAVDRNHVNWARGGNFNPSGQVRVPSLRGDGTGVFGAAVVRQFSVVSSDDPELGPPTCPLS